MDIPPPSPEPAASLLARLLDLLVASGEMRACFDDLSGITIDYPEFALPERRQIHDCAHCLLAKQPGAWDTQVEVGDCAMNKRATNYLAIRRKHGLHGLCHLGLFDLVEPLIYHGVVLGVFYYGQVSVKEWRLRSEKKIRRHCARRHLDPAPFLRTFSAAPSIRQVQIGDYRRRLLTIVESVGLICESLAVPVDRYRVGWEAMSWRFLAKKPTLIQAVGSYIAKNYDKPCRVSDLAQRFHCHPNYLGSFFQRCVGQSLGDFVSVIRIDRAKHLLQTGRFSIGEIAYKCGFSDLSQFGKVFRRFAGHSPSDYRALFEKHQHNI